MKSSKVLEMIKKGRLEDLKIALQDEVYQDSLKGTVNAKKRYAAMKRYFTYHTSAIEYLMKPCTIIFEDRPYTCFTNSWSLALTTEPTGEIELFDESNGKYPDIKSKIRFDGIKKKIDFNKVIAEAKSKGYKLSKKEVGHRFQYLMLYDGAYYKIGLIDATYGIINNGEPAMTYHPDGEKTPLTIQNDLGFCIIMPVFMHAGKPDESHTVIEVK